MSQPHSETPSAAPSQGTNAVLSTEVSQPAHVPRDELLAALNELLEAERAGARVALDTVRETTSPQLTSMVQDVHKDEVHWCGMLMRVIKSIDGTPSSTTGAFWGKAMAIADVEERLTFLNRGQSWVVRKLQALIPRIEDAGIRAELAAMLEAHQANIQRIDARPTAPPKADGARQG